MMKKNLTILPLVAGLSALAIISVHAQLFDYQIQTGTEQQSGAAVLGSSTDPTFNQFGGTATDTTGTTTINVAFPDGFNYGGGTNTPNTAADPGTQALYSNSFFNPGDFSISLSNLAFNQNYTLVLYDGGTGASPANVTVTGAGTYTGFVSDNSFSISDGNGVAYTELMVQSSATGTLSIVESSAGGNGYTGANGFQLEATQNVPEPSTYALFVLGGVLALAIGSRRKLKSLV